MIKFNVYIDISKADP